MSTVGASTSTLSYLQSLLQQGSAKDAKKTSAADPLAMLMQAISGDDEAPAQTSTTASAPAKAGHCQSFSSETMATLLSAQSEPDNPSAKLFAKLDADGDGAVSAAELGRADRGGHRHHQHVESGAASVTSVERVSGTAGSAASGSTAENTLNKRAANLLEQLIGLQSQVLNVATSTMSAVA